jgi:hypothetical protein
VKSAKTLEKGSIPKMKNKYHLYSLMVGAMCLLTAIGVFGQDGSSKTGPGKFIRITCNTDKTNYLAGERIELRIVVTNYSDQPFQVGGYAPVAFFRYRVLGLDDHREAPMTRMGQSLLAPDRYYALSTKEIKPGHSYTNTVIVNQLFDVTFPQIYEVTVSIGNAQSNPVHFVQDR